jgi:hypothetical protein
MISTHSGRYNRLGCVEIVEVIELLVGEGRCWRPVRRGGLEGDQLGEHDLGIAPPLRYVDADRGVAVEDAIRVAAG